MSYTTHCPLCAQDGHPQVPARYQMQGWRVCFDHIGRLTSPQLILRYPELADDEAKTFRERFKEAVSR